MLASQMGAPNSPQWFNTGLHWAYGIDGPAQGHYYVDHRTGELCRSESAYEHPQPHACFIQSVADDLVNEGGIMDLWTREARLFKYGSGTGTNFSSLRGENEKLSGDTVYCHIRVADNGIGFDQLYGEKIFELFQRLHGRLKYQGTGIGLAIVKKIVENHGGVITAQGELNKGATFDIYIPTNHIR